MTCLNKSLLKPIEYPDLIRLGKHNDGGYVVPKFIVQSVDVLVSFGISNDWSFEQDFRKINPKVRIEAYDPTINASIFRHTVRQSFMKMLFNLPFFRIEQARWHCHRYREFNQYYQQYINFFGANKDIQHFEKWIAPSSDQASIAPSDIFNRLIAENQHVSVFLKSDIEGAEYGVLDQIASFSQFIKCIVIEWHEIDRRLDFNRLIAVLLKDFSIVHVHGNNYAPVNELEDFPTTIELTLVNNALLEPLPDKLPRPTKSCPVPGLDEPNNPNQPDYLLNFD